MGGGTREAKAKRKGDGKAAWVGKSSVGMGRGRSNFDNHYYLRTFLWRKERVNWREKGEH